jgi:hypothetical protein
VNVTAATVGRVAVPAVPDGSRLILTAPAPPAGTVVSAGSLLGAVSGRPVFALPGAFPAYRPLTRGDRGIDVRQLQDGLKTAGLRLGTDQPGTFGVATDQAIRRLYRFYGYEPLGSSSAVLVPVGEISFQSTLPARVQMAARAVGTTLTPSSHLATLTTGGVTLTLSLPNDEQGQRASPGQQVSGAVGGERFTGSVVSVHRPSAQTNEDQTQARVVLLVRPDRPVPARLVGRAGTGVVEVSRAPKAGLVVPATALYDDGTQRWVVKRTGQRDQRVPVTVRFSSGGKVLIDGPALAPGNQVVLGVAPTGIGTDVPR